MNKYGYTMAEMLITLAIIGVTAAILYPVVSKTPPNMEMLMLKKAHSNIARASSEMLMDESLYPYANESGLGDTSSVRYMGRYYSGNTKYCGILAAKLDAMPIGNAAICPTFRTQDGVHYTVNGRNVTVDVLGDKCNRQGVTGCQNTRVFSFDVNESAQLIPAGNNANLAQQYLDETNMNRREYEFD